MVPNRSFRLVQRLYEAYYSSHPIPDMKNVEDFLDQVASLLVDNPNDTRPIHMLYMYFVRIGAKDPSYTSREQLLQRLGNVLMRNYRASFEEAQTILNLVVRRLAAVGHLRSKQRHRYHGYTDDYAGSEERNR